RVAKDRFYGGKSVVIDHGHGVFSGYFHLDEFKVKLGDFVKRGDIIALSGNTGRSTGPHLHFMFKIDDVIVNPLQAIDILNSLKN
ncbi:MAG: M23 family metallopeptidase, partial [Aliarcobacter sp.]